jgi:hypothetical protein
MDELYTMTDAERQEYEAEYNEWLDSIPDGPLPTPDEDFFDELNEYEELEEEYIDDPYKDEEDISAFHDWQAERELDFN